MRPPWSPLKCTARAGQASSALGDARSTLPPRNKYMLYQMFDPLLCRPKSCEGRSFAFRFPWGLFCGPNYSCDDCQEQCLTRPSGRVALGQKMAGQANSGLAEAGSGCSDLSRWSRGSSLAWRARLPLPPAYAFSSSISCMITAEQPRDCPTCTFREGIVAPLARLGASNNPQITSGYAKVGPCVAARVPVAAAAS
jgi:hypothetical protein